ncbi:chemotaxis protein CheW [Thermomonas flagellata]|uniref:chemotaxis protein CheW n=1 Tax=Thermomonas flagellata TaxID=2888524 RepID=UPI001F037626|nr:chemotaxis protein CheW [Thermomonas flagellata]
MSDSAPIIRGVLVQVADTRLLLPNATIAEVLSYARPEPVEGAPDWLLGRIRWRGWRVPLVAFARFAGHLQEEAGFGSKVVVLKALGGDPRQPYFAVLTQGFPRLVTVTQQALRALPAEAGELPPGVLAQVMLNEDAAVVPDLPRLEREIRAVLAA